eukprot:scaffold16807_cov16-Prasinocladus_malaysianus.AAC.1
MVTIFGVSTPGVKLMQEKEGTAALSEEITALKLKLSESLASTNDPQQVACFHCRTGCWPVTHCQLGDSIKFVFDVSLRAWPVDAEAVMKSSLSIVIVCGEKLPA